MNDPADNPTVQHALEHLNWIIDETAASLRSQGAVLRQQGMSLPPVALDSLQDVRRDLDALAGQVAGEIVERDQLRALAETAGLVTSSLDINQVLNKVMDTVITLTGAQRGYIVLREPATGEMAFRVARNLERETIDEGEFIVSRSIVSQVAQTGEAVIATNAQTDPDFSGHASVMIHGLRSILCVPLVVRGTITGVVYVDNRIRDGLFGETHRSLLMAFANQAAVAIENARLFDMTDQQLALRVQELDTMQRIDHELNRTLNLSSVVDITMDWALRKSGSEAGILAILDREQGVLRIVASYGYPPDSPFGRRDDPEQMVYPADRGIVGRVIRSAQPSLITDVSIDPDYEETLADCVAQLTVPLFSANRVIGVIVLESAREGQLDLLDLDFVARLAEHASPAIVNAQLYQELQRANQAKSEFVSFVAHDLKNPMTSMKGYTDLLLKGVVGPLNEQQSGFLSTILNNVTRMETLVSDLNDLTKQETGNMRLDIAPVDFRAVVDETIRAQQRQIDEKEQDLTLQVPFDLPLVLGDHTRLVQIMTNFVSNANKYTPPGGTITITAEAARNTWDPGGAPQVIHCTVQDTGIGMSEEDLDQLFVPYFRSENPKTREQPGTGLGLTITRGLVEQHGGRVWVESALEAGTTFHFTLPLATEVEQASPARG